MRLEGRDLGYKYGEGPWLFRNLSITIRSGEVVGLTGPSGSGKTSLARLLAGYALPLEGQVSVDDRNDELLRHEMENAAGAAGAVNAVNAVNAAGAVNAVDVVDAVNVTDAEAKLRGTAVAPNYSSVLKRRDLRNRYYPVQLIQQHPERAVNPRWRIERILTEGWTPDSALLESIGVSKDWMNRYPNELSGGELQRCCIARALGPETRFLIADEMTTMLDAVTQAQIWHAVLEIARLRQLGILVISHDPPLVERICHRIINIAE